MAERDGTGTIDRYGLEDAAALLVLHGYGSLRVYVLLQVLCVW